MAKWVLRRMSGYCGAMMMGRDLNDMTPSDFDFVKQALFEHGVVVLPDQHLSQDAHIAVAEAFGPIEVNRFFTPVDDHPMIAEVRTTSVQTGVIGGTWHTDHSYDAAPAMCSILSAQKLPPYGGDTHFASMTAAYHGLSPGLGQLLGGLKAWHSDSSFSDSKLGLNENPDAFRYPVLHPVVVRHPQTGAPCLYVNGDFTTHFEGWSREESAPLLAYLYAHATQPIFTCRVQWRPGMVAIWDNRLVQHYATADYAGHDRLMHRITVQGVPLSGL